MPPSRQRSNRSSRRGRQQLLRTATNRSSSENEPGPGPRCLSNNAGNALSPRQRATQELQRMMSYLRAPGFQNRIVERCLTGDERRLWKRLENARRRRGSTRNAPLDLWYARHHNMTHPRAIVTLASRMGAGNPASLDWILEAICASSAPSQSLRRIVWDRERGELRIDGQIVRRVRSVSVATNIGQILDAFQKGSWRSTRVANPLADDQKMREAVSTLNEGLVNNAIRFASDGTGTGVLLQFTVSDNRRTRNRRIRHRRTRLRVS
jgi:hypothetical protein